MNAELPDSLKKRGSLWTPYQRRVMLEMYEVTRDEDELEVAELLMYQLAGGNPKVQLPVMRTFATFISYFSVFGILWIVFDVTGLTRASLALCWVLTLAATVPFVVIAYRLNTASVRQQKQDIKELVESSPRGDWVLEQLQLAMHRSYQ